LNNIQYAAEEILAYKKRVHRKEWMTSEILYMIKERRLAKRKIQKYNQIQEYMTQDKKSKK